MKKHWNILSKKSINLKEMHPRSHDNHFFWESHIIFLARCKFWGTGHNEHMQQAWRCERPHTTCAQGVGRAERAYSALTRASALALSAFRRCTSSFRVSGTSSSWNDTEGGGFWLAGRGDCHARPRLSTFGPQEGKSHDDKLHNDKYFIVSCAMPSVVCTKSHTATWPNSTENPKQKPRWGLLPLLCSEGEEQRGCRGVRMSSTHWSHEHQLLGVVLLVQKEC